VSSFFGGDQLSGTWPGPLRTAQKKLYKARATIDNKIT
jgi:hypothetical protein